jgi:hypothetical protein
MWYFLIHKILIRMASQVIPSSSQDIAMTQAHGLQLPPLGTNSTSGTSLKSSTNDHEFASSGHAIVMCFAFLIVFPLGVFMVRVLESVKLHMYIQSVAFVLVLLGFISGIVVSESYNRVSPSHSILELEE